MSASEVFTKWSAEAAPNSTASDAPPRLSNSSAWILSGNPRVPRAGQDLTRLFEVEGLVLAENIHKRQGMVRSVSPPPIPEHGEHGGDDLVHIALRVVFIFGGNGVRAEEGDGEVERAFVVEREQGFEQAQFGGGLQAVTRLGLGGGCAMCEHAQQARTRLRDERLDAGHARGADGGEDAPARGEDVEIGHAAHLHLEFVRAVTCPDDVRVRVHEARHDNAMPRVERGFIGIGGAQIVGGANRDDFLVTHDDRAVFEDAERAEGVSALRAAREGQELGSRVDEHG